MTDLPFVSATHVYSEMFRFTPHNYEVWNTMHQTYASRVYFKLKAQL